MSDALWIALVSLAGTLVVTGLGALTAWAIRVSRRIRQLERRSRLDWLYIRQLIDHSYRHGAIPLPDPPEGWLEDPPE